MTPIIHFQCKSCEAEVVMQPSAASRVTCSHCKRQFDVFISESLIGRNMVTVCVSCGHDTLYVQKDFNRRVGVAIVVLGIAISIYFFARSQPMLAMAALALTAVVDFVAYVLVRDVTVCYACHTVYRGFQRNPEHEPFDLKKLEKYGGRTPRPIP